MSLQVIQNTTGYMNPAAEILDTGWTIGGIYAIHTSCNAGNIISNTGLNLTIGKQYVVQYTVDNYVNGGVNVILGTTNGASRTANGTYTETLTCTGISQMSFYSNGALRISILSFYDPATAFSPGTTISFNERAEKWTEEASYNPELMIKFIDSLFSVKNGQLWLHNDNAIRGNFYSQQYSAQVIFIVNQEYQNSKLWYNMRLDSVGNWYVKSMDIVPSDQFPNGMHTEISKSNFKSIDGKLWADILRDMGDPEFSNITDIGLRNASSLFRGRMMQGGYLIVTMQCDDTTEASLSSAEFYYVDVQKSL
jgi:hypothetical protein